MHSDERVEATARLPQVFGPVTGGIHDRPFSAAMSPIARSGYLEEEYFLEGEAAHYELAPGEELRWDGRWTVQLAGTEPYRTRILVRRPLDPARFNGTLLLTWMNVSAGWDWWDGETPEILDGGYAVVGVTCQKIGIDGQTEPSPSRPDLGPPVPEGLRIWDPTRYGDLSIPGDHLSWDIYTQAARLLRRRLGDASEAVLGDLEVERVVAYGMSQGANLLATYVNAFHALERVFDGFILERYVGSGMSLPFAGRRDPPAFIGDGSHLVRGDITEPVLVINAEGDASQGWAARQPDTDRFRVWEVAGVSHVGMWSSERFAGRYMWEFGRPWPRRRSPEDPNWVSLVPVVDAGFRRMHEWLADGRVPHSVPRIEISGDPPRIQRDARSCAIGGARLPEVDAPLFRHIGVNEEGLSGVLGLRGRSIPLDQEELAALYPDPSNRLTRFRAAAARAVDAGYLLPHDAEEMLDALEAPAPM